VLAGLIDDQDRKNISGIPGLANLPLLGRLFSAHTDDQSKTEIVLSITPHIIRSRTPQLAHEAEVWIGPEGRTGKTSPSPSFQKGASPFIVPKPAPAAAKPASAVDAPSNLNIPLPSGFSLGGGLNPLAAPGKTE
jgi:general secretion pathway protein D